MNGKPDDNPITDMLFYGKHPFPADVKAMIRKLHALDRRLMNDLNGSRTGSPPQARSRAIQAESGNRRRASLGIRAQVGAVNIHGTRERA
jgi:hypothetical protein